MARTAVEEKPTEAGETSTGEQDVNQPITAVGYDANGEAVDVPVDTRVEPPLPGFEDETPGEMFEGKRVIGHKWSFTGNHEISPRNQALADKLDTLTEGKSVLLLVEVEPGDVSFVQSTEDGHIKGVFHKRKLHVTNVYAADDMDGSDALFEGGLIRVRREEPDDIGYLTTDPEGEGDEEPEAANDLASSLMAAGLCGKVHPGHLNKCRAAAHACELPEAG